MLAAVMLFLIMLSGLSTPAHAQSSTCRSLQAQLAQVETGRGSGSSQQYQRFDRAVRDQTVQIRKTENASLRNGCQFRNSNNCLRIRDSLAKMYANLRSLESQRDSFAPSGGTRAQRAAIVQSMQRNGCGAETPRQASTEAAPDRRQTLLEQIFGNKTYTSEGAVQEGGVASLGGGTYRTLCVRTCDGYYFPISFSTSQKRFEEDLAQCQQMCPGTETALFVHPMPGGDAENSISYRTGQPYASLENAFAYRKMVNRECSCRSITMTGFEELAGSTEVREVEPETRTVILPVPTFRQDIALGEETLMNEKAGMTIEKLAGIATGAGDETQRSGNIRIVGPAFFPVQ